VVTAFTILLVITSLLLILMVLLHKGRGGGLSDMFGGGGGSAGLSGSSVAERNLDRITIGIGLIWIACVVALGLILQ
jgi:preprotein translocase subunit SecG